MMRGPPPIQDGVMEPDGQARRWLSHARALIRDRVLLLRGSGHGLVEFVWRNAHLFSLAHDVSDGGLELALREAAAWSGHEADVDLVDGDGGKPVGRLHRFEPPGQHRPGNGQITINARPIDAYLAGQGTEWEKLAEDQYDQLFNEAMNAVGVGVSANMVGKIVGKVGAKVTTGYLNRVLLIRLGRYASRLLRPVTKD